MREAADATGHGVGIFADLQGPKIRLGQFADGLGAAREGPGVHDHHPRRPGRRRRSARRRTTGLPGDVAAGDPILIDDGKVRLRVTDGRRHRRAHRGRGRPAGSATTRASTCPASRSPCRRCPRRTSRTCAGRCTSRVDFIALSFVRSAADVEDVRKIMHEEGVHAPGHRQDREAAGDRQPRRDRRRVRRLHGRPRRPRRGVPARGRAVPAEAGHREGPAQRQAGDRRHPDARVDDLRAGAHPRRGLRRRQRGARRRRRGDALRRDQRGGVPDRAPSRRWPGSSSPPRTTGCTAWPRSTGSPRTRAA